jgi:hypothetical protein
MLDIDPLPSINTADLGNDKSVNHSGEVTRNTRTYPEGKMDEIIIPIGHEDG